MKLTELFKTNEIDVTWDKQSANDLFVASSIIGERKIQVFIEKLTTSEIPNSIKQRLKNEDPSIWELRFLSAKPNEKFGGTFELTGEGNEFEVFSFVVSVIQKWIKEHNQFDGILFDVDKNEQRRTNLYLKVAMVVAKRLNVDMAVSKANGRGYDVYVLAPKSRLKENLMKRDGEWVLTSKTSGKVLRRYGKKKPSEKKVAEDERNIHAHAYYSRKK